jgi:hypothetical protein
MNYQIIKDEKVLKDFIKWLPELEKDEVYVVNLFARNKYCKDIVHINSDKAQMKRFAATKDWLFRKIKQLETEVGNYWQQDIPIPQEALALYITINPRSQVKAAKNLLIKLAKLVTEPYNSYNVSAEALSELQKAVGRKLYFDLDIDFDPFFTTKQDHPTVGLFLKSVYENVSAVVNMDAVTIIRTRGGAHVLVRLDQIDSNFKKTWYKEITTIPGVDVKGSDALIPVLGCTQGNFVPNFYQP